MNFYLILLLPVFLRLTVNGYEQAVYDYSGDFAEYPDELSDGSAMPPMKNLSTLAEPGPNSGEDDVMYGNSGEQPIPVVPPKIDEELQGETAEPPRPVDDMQTGTPEESTPPPKDIVEVMTDETEPIVDDFSSTTPFDIDNMETGAPEASTKEPYMPKPVTKPKPGSHPSNETYSGSSDSPYSTDFTDSPGGSSDLPSESIPPIHWTKSTPRDFTISQKIDTNSPGYNQLLHMLEDLRHRRNEEFSDSNQTEFYINRASTLMDTIETDFTDIAILNITKAQVYIQGLLADSSLSVRQAYSEIKSLTAEPSFYYIPKRQRFQMVHQIITDLSSSAQNEIWNLNSQAKTFCRNSNVDTPPYSLGNLVGNRLGNGAVLTK